jgi:hypothetical protein
MCEDDDQAAYLEWLRSEFDHPLLVIRKLPGRMSAQDAATAARRVRRSEREKGTHFDEVWCLISVSTTKDLTDAINPKRARDVRIAGVVGAFPDWLKLHWEESESLPHILVHEASSAGFAAALQDRIDIALRRAAAARDRTTIDLLIQALSKSNDSNGPGN